MVRRKKRRSRNGLSETDIHYIVGFLYVITRREDVVVLGDKILDETTGSRRDVDIVVSGEWGLLGVEVKDKGRALDVGLVEGLCRKLADMPSLRERAIVSSSSYTRPARRKAAAHGVKCLHLVRGSLPQSFRGADLSTLDALTQRAASWVSPPTVVVHTVSSERLEKLPYATLLSTPHGSPNSISTLGELVARMPDRYSGPGGEVHLTVQIEYPLAIELDGNAHQVTSIDLRGSLRVTETRSEPRAMCYLADEADEPLAAVVLFDYAGGLLGVASTNADGRVSVIPIPAHLRPVRPIRQRLR
jgi:hypothetical protein